MNNRALFWIFNTGVTVFVEMQFMEIKVIL